MSLSLFKGQAPLYYPFPAHEIPPDDLVHGESSSAYIVKSQVPHTITGVERNFSRQ